MAVVSLQTSNVFSYTFSGHGNTHFNHIVIANNTPVLNIGGQSWTLLSSVKEEAQAALMVLTFLIWVI